jgi:hypothetical protein
MNTEEGRTLPAPANGPRPGDFELGSPQSRAAATRMLVQRMEGRVRRDVIIGVEPEKPRADEYGKHPTSEEFSRLVAGNGWNCHRSRFAHHHGNCHRYSVTTPSQPACPLNPTAGTISGTPSAAAAPANYIVAASSATAKTTATLQISIAIPAPSDLFKYATRHGMISAA